MGVGDGDDAVEGVLADFEGKEAGFADGGAIAEEVDGIEGDGFSGIEGCFHGCLVLAFDADDFDVGPVGF